MRIRNFTFLFCLFYQFCVGQASSNIPLRGQVVTDSIRIDYGYVINLNSKIRTTIKPEGFFEIPAQQKDTLLFLGLAFQSKKMVLTRMDFMVPLLKVKLKSAVNKLDEVVISKKNKLNPNIAGSQGIVDQKYFDDQWSSPKNAIYTPSGSFENMTDFVRMFKDLKKILKKKPKPIKYQYTFIELVLNNFNYSFFANPLHLKEDEITLFLIFCENDPKSNTYLNNFVEFELADFLITKNEEFKRLTTFEK